MLKEFRAFLFRGNLVELAVAVVIGVAFGAVINALVKDLLTPLIALLFGEPSFGNLHFTIRGTRFPYGAFLDSLITFFSVATAVFFFVIKPVNLLLARLGEVEPDKRACPECLTQIPVAAKRCAACTAEVAPAR